MPGGHIRARTPPPLPEGATALEDPDEEGNAADDATPAPLLLPGVPTPRPVLTLPSAEPALPRTVPKAEAASCAASAAAAAAAAGVAAAAFPKPPVWRGFIVFGGGWSLGASVAGLLLLILFVAEVVRSRC